MSDVDSFEIQNSLGMKLRALNYGAIIQRLEIPTKQGFKNVVLGYDDPDDYLSDRAYIGAIAGRYANRIGGASFSIDGEFYRLTANEGKNQLHGGFKGFNKAFWSLTKTDKATLEFKYLSKDLEEGFPGNLEVTITYHISEQNELVIEYSATTDKSTIVNLTQHSYFNLNGDTDVLNFGDQLLINTSKVVEVDEQLIPTGRIIDLEGSVLDFSRIKTLGPFLKELSSELRNTKGFDHCYAFNNKGKMKHMATLTGSETGIKMEVHSTEPGIQLYTGNHLESPFKPYSAVCLETQHYPDSPNQGEFPSARLNPGETYRSKTIYRFKD